MAKFVRIRPTLVQHFPNLRRSGSKPAACGRCVQRCWDQQLRSFPCDNIRAAGSAYHTWGILQEAPQWLDDSPCFCVQRAAARQGRSPLARMRSGRVRGRLMGRRRRPPLRGRRRGVGRRWVETANRRCTRPYSGDYITQGRAMDQPAQGGFPLVGLILPQTCPTAPHVSPCCTRAVTSKMRSRSA